MSVQGHLPDGHLPTGHIPESDGSAPPTPIMYITDVVLAIVGAIAALMPERMTQRVQYTFSDAAGVQVTPSGARYRVDCLTTGRQVRDWTAIDGAQASGMIDLSVTDTAIIDRVNPRERKVVHVEGSYGETHAARNRIEFTVERLTGLG